MRTGDVRRAFGALTMVVSLVSCFGDGDGGGGDAPVVEGCDFDPWALPDDAPVGHGWVENIALATLRGKPLTITSSTMEGAMFAADLDCFTWEIGDVIEEPGHGTASLQEGGAWTYTPAEGFAGFDSFVVRVDFTIIDDPLCAGAGPLDDGFLHEQTTGGGADLARIGVHVISPAPTLLPPCSSGDCVRLEVLDSAGERIPTFFLRTADGYDHEVSGCSAAHWIADTQRSRGTMYLLDQPGIRAEDYEQYYFGLSTFPHEFPVSPSYWHGDCGFGPKTTESTRTLTIERRDFASYCAAAKFNMQSYALELPTADRITRLSSAGPVIDEDWPVLPGASARRALDTELQPNPGDEDLSQYREQLKMTDASVLFSFVSTILRYLGSEDEPKVRAVHYGAAWGAFEGKMLALIAKEQSGEWVDMPLADKSAAIGDLAVAFNAAMGDRWPRLAGWVSEYVDIVDTANQVSMALVRMEKVYRVFEVDPSDPLQVAEALSAYLELLAQITGKIAPPVGAYANVLSEGVKNMLPAMRIMRDRTQQTNAAIELWLADAETFAREWEKFVVPAGAPSTPALDLTDTAQTSQYPPAWDLDIDIVKRNTAYHASRYDHAEHWYKETSVTYVTTNWARSEEFLRQKYSGATLETALAMLLAKRRRMAEDLAVAFAYRTRARIELYTSRKHYIELLRAARADDPAAQRFLDHWEQALIGELGEHPWERARARADQSMSM